MVKSKSNCITHSENYGSAKANAAFKSISFRSPFRFSKVAYLFDEIENEHELKHDLENDHIVDSQSITDSSFESELESHSESSSLFSLDASFSSIEDGLELESYVLDSSVIENVNILPNVSTITTLSLDLFDDLHDTFMYNLSFEEECIYLNDLIPNLNILFDLEYINFDHVYNISNLFNLEYKDYDDVYNLENLFDLEYINFDDVYQLKHFFAIENPAFDDIGNTFMRHSNNKENELCKKNLNESLKRNIDNIFNFEDVINISSLFINYYDFSNVYDLSSLFRERPTYMSYTIKTLIYRKIVREEIKNRRERKKIEEAKIIKKRVYSKKN